MNEVRDPRLILQTEIEELKARIEIDRMLMDQGCAHVYSESQIAQKITNNLLKLEALESFKQLMGW